MSKSVHRERINGLTMADVAKAAGVSTMTVSRVLNRSPRVSASTRLKVEAIIQRLNFAPDPSARGLRSGRSFTIGLVYDNPNAEYVAEMQLGVLDVTLAAGYELIAHPCDFRSEQLTSDILSFVRRLRVDGIILIPPVSENQNVVDELLANEVQLIRIASAQLDTKSQFVLSNDRRAAADMVHYLIGLGHVKIGFVSGPGDFRSAQERLAGYKEQLKKHSLPVIDDYIVEGGYTFESGIKCGERLLSLDEPPTAIFASNDEMAAGVIKAAHGKGLKVPQQLSVAGFDDSRIASHLSPSLTTVKQPVSDMGRSAASQLLESIGEPLHEFATPREAITQTLVVRESTGSAKPAAQHRASKRFEATQSDRDDYLFPAEPNTRALARELYQSIRHLPIISPHGHTDPRWFANNEPFTDPTSLFLTPDHYLLRMLHSNGVSMATLGVGVAEDDRTFDARQAWRILAENFYLFRATPSGLWTQQVLRRVFGIHEPLTCSTADAIYDEIAHALQQPDFKPRALFESFNIEFLATTESATDDLAYHKALMADSWPGRVVTTYRPDNVTNPDFENFKDDLEQFGEMTGQDTMQWSGYLEAHRIRRQEFIHHGATATDHGHPTARTGNLSARQSEDLFQTVVAGKHSPEQAEQFRAQALTEMARMSLDDGLVMQIHPGSYRNHSPAMLAKYGFDLGFDIPMATDYVNALKPLLDQFGNDPSLSLIVFTLDESTYSRELAPLAGVYPALKLGPAWWFHDSPAGMMRFRERTTETAGFYNTVGFNDDTRAFMSIPVRHDVARRVDCAYLAKLVVEQRLSMEDAYELAHDLTYKLPKQAYRVDG